MAVTTTALFPGNGNYRIELETELAGGVIYATVYVRKLGGSGFWTATSMWYRLQIAGHNFDSWWKYDFRNTTRIAIAHHSVGVGYGSHTVAAWVNMDSGIGQGYTAQTINHVQPASAPSAPSITSVDRITTTSARVSYTAGAANGSGIIETRVQWSRTSDFSQVQWTDTLSGTGVYSEPAGLNVQLTPGTTYYVRVQHRNGVNWGAWSGTRQLQTLPSSAALITVGSRPDGRSALVTLSPPGGASGVTEYIIESQQLPSGAVVSRTSTSRTLTVSDLIPGASYRWRAAAKFGANYTSPFSAWITVAQLNPNTNPGDYFDGSMPDRGDISFRFTGAEHQSTSVSEGVGVAGWDAQPAGYTALQRITGGVAGQHAARMLFVQDMDPNGGASVGPSLSSRAAVDPGTLYVGSIYVRPSRPQRLGAIMYWLNAAGGVINAEWGTSVLVEDTTGYTRLTITRTAPANAAWAVVRALDLAGPGWVNWRATEYVDADAAMVTLSTLFPYFDGSMVDTAEYRYDWLGAPNITPSSRTQLPPGPDLSLQDPDCPPVPPAPKPPSIVESCIDEVGIWRRFWLTIPASEVTEWLDVLPTFRVLTGTFPARQVRVRYYANPDDLPPSTYPIDEWESEQIISYVPPYTVMTLDGLSETVTASVDGADPVLADHLLYGSGGMPATWPVLSCGIGYLISFDVPLDLPGADLTLSLELTQRM